MKLSIAVLALAVAVSATEPEVAASRFLKKARGGKGKADKATAAPVPVPPTPTARPTAGPTAAPTEGATFASCNTDGTSRFPYRGADNSERLLLREGIISSIPKSLCGNKDNKNVILVIGDGMGWEMVRAGAIAKQILTELEGMGIDTKNGNPGTALATEALAKFAGRSLSDYFTSGPGNGLSFQDQLENFALVTTTTTVIGEAEKGNHYAPATSLLSGNVGDHEDGLSPLALNECGYPIDFSPLDFELEGGNMVLWNDEYGGKYPWDERYYGAPATGLFDKTYIMQHATDSANTAGTMATGHKASVNMVSVNLYEEKVSTLVEDAMRCGKAGGVITSVPILHATPAAFVAHSNNRNNANQLQTSFRAVNPTFAAGACGGSLNPPKSMRDDILTGSLASEWTFLFQGKNDVLAENFYDSVQSLDPDNGDHLLVCFGGEYSVSGEQNMPFRGLDSSYSNRWCSNAETIKDADGNPTGFKPTSVLCDHYPAEDLVEIPKMKDNVREALNFLGKDDDGFFLMYEQGDIDWAAHANHMDDMLGAMLDISDGVQEIIDWVQANGGWEKNALYVTADHDHYLTLNDDFPEIVATHIINGDTHNMTPQNNSNKNPWSAAISAGRVEDPSQDQVEDIADFATWTPEDIANVGHFWGAVGTGGNGWGSHSTRPVGLWYMGDEGCIAELTGKDFQVLGRTVKGSEGKIDQMHLHACMLKNLFGLGNERA